MKNNKNYKSADAALNSINQQLVKEFKYKSKNRVFEEFKECKDIFAKLDYAKQLKKDAYDHVYDLDLDSVIRKLQNQIIINH